MMLLSEWSAVEQMREAFRPPTASLVQQWFNEMEAALLPEIKSEYADGISAKMIDFSNIFDFNKWKQRFITLLQDAIRRILDEGVLAGMLRAGIGAPTQEQLESRNIQYDILAKQITRSELVTQNTEKDLIGMLTEMVQANATQQQMQEAMRDKFQGYARWRVDRITNTVVVGAWESGSLLAWQEAGITSKGWLATQDGRVRPTHDAANGQEVDINDSFTVGSAQLKHPGDPNGPVGEIVNCRCTMIPILED